MKKCFIVMILPLFLVGFIGESKFPRIKICLNRDGIDIQSPFPDSVKKYFSKKEIPEFEKGGVVGNWANDSVGVIYITFYKLRANSKYIESEGYFYKDSPIEKFINYFPNGKISFEKNYAVFNDSTRETVDLSTFNKNHNSNRPHYSIALHGKNKYYSEEGKLIKTEEYDKGKLVKTW